MPAIRRFLNLFREDSLREQFDDELRFHLQMRIDANMGKGMNREDAEREARLHLGRPMHVKEGMREARVVSWIDTLSRDFQHGARLLLRQPILACLAVLTLSLGIGANAAIFSLLNAALLKPLPFPNSDRLVAIVDGFRTDGASNIPPTVPELIDVRKTSHTLDGLSFYDTRDFQINGGNEPERVFAARVEASFLSLLGARPIYGRLFQDGEDLPGRDHVIILSNSLWRRNFGSDPGIIGRQVILNGEASTVIGVLPENFAFDYQSAERIEMFVPFPMNETYTSRNSPFVNLRRVSAVALLKPEYGIDAAAAEIQTVSQALAKEYPALYHRGSDAQDTGFFMTAISLHEALTGPNHDVLALLFASVALVLLIACVNTAQFLLSRSMEREAEVAVRHALGASRTRLVAQFLTESMILGVAGGALGLLQAFWFMKILLAILPARIPLALIGRIHVDLAVLAFTTAAAFIAIIVSGIAPALRFAAHDPAPSMVGRGFVPVRARGQQVLIAVEVALSALLLVVAGLLIQSLLELRNAPAGYSAEGVTVMQMRLGPRALLLERKFVEAVAALPGVDSAAIADWPLPVGTNTDFSIEAATSDAATLSRQLASYRIVTPEYFQTVRVPLRDGRAFSAVDTKNSAAVAIVNEEMVRRFWPGQSAIGRRITAGTGPRRALMTIIGVVGNVRPALQTTAVPQIYVPHSQQDEPNATLIVRSSGAVMVSVETVKKAIQSVLPDQPVFNVRPLADMAAEPLSNQRATAFLIGSFAFLALFMSITGMFTVMNYLTSRRTREIAIRLAVGATSRNVLGVVAGRTLGWTAIGLALGLAGSVGVVSALRGTLRGMAQLNPWALGAVAGMYVLLAASAVAVPVFKALRIDPASTLRMD
jgi:putative ABC transport system permease protein